MNSEQESELRNLERERERAAKALPKVGKEDGLEISYAESYKAIVGLRHAVGERGVMGIKRAKYRIGVS